jgi:regulator of replication initiation timing
VSDDEKWIRDEIARVQKAQRINDAELRGCGNNTYRRVLDRAHELRMELSHLRTRLDEVTK